MDGIEVFGRSPAGSEIFFLGIGPSHREGVGLGAGNGSRHDQVCVPMSSTSKLSVGSEMGVFNGCRFFCGCADRSGNMPFAMENCCPLSGVYPFNLVRGMARCQD